MAELLLKVGSVGISQGYQDGDIVCAFHDHRIQSGHAETICLPRDGQGYKPVNRDGFRQDATGLAQFWFDRVYQYRFERVNRTEIKRILLSDMSEEVLSATPNVDGEALDVQQFVERRLNYAKRADVKGGGKAVFGTPGAEIWYGGSMRLTPAALTIIWNQIESQTSNLRSAFTRWPATPTEKRHFLWLAVDDFNDQTQTELVAKDEDLADPDQPVLVRKRKRFVAFRAMSELSTRLNDIDDRTIEVDVRTQETFSRSTIVGTKL